jgi:redox-sensing transcriptional repressor
MEDRMYSIAIETLQRLPMYLRYLKELQSEGIDTVSSTTIAERFKSNPVQVRKDLASISDQSGKPRTGFEVDNLVYSITEFLGYNNINEAILVGAGQLGSALFNYDGFKNYGLNIVAAFDNNIEIKAKQIKGKPVLHISKLPSLVKRMGIHIGIITVPAESAQSVCDLMIESGIKAIWNFSPTHIVVPSNIALKNEDMATSLAVLSQRLSEILKNESDLNL